jgi:hypothetical protein
MSRAVKIALMGLLALSATGGQAQSPPAKPPTPPAPASAPEVAPLSALEKGWIDSMRERQLKLQQDFILGSAELAERHPGFHLNPNTWAMEKDAPPEAKPKSP